MPGIPTKCENPACPGPPNTVATYKHVHGALTKTWSAAALGPTAEGLPYPSPCPSDGTMCNAASVRCTTCGWTKQYS